MNDFLQQAAQLSPQIYEQFKLAVASGKWPDGRPLSAEQQDIVLQAVIVYENQHLPQEQRTAWVQDQCASRNDDAPQTIQLKD